MGDTRNRGGFPGKKFLWNLLGIFAMIPEECRRYGEEVERQVQQLVLNAGAWRLDVRVSRMTGAAPAPGTYLGGVW